MRLINRREGNWRIDFSKVIAVPLNFIFCIKNAENKIKNFKIRNDANVFTLF